MLKAFSKPQTISINYVEMEKAYLLCVVTIFKLEDMVRIGYKNTHFQLITLCTDICSPDWRCTIGDCLIRVSYFHYKVYLSNIHDRLCMCFCLPCGHAVYWKYEYMSVYICIYLPGYLCCCNSACTLCF